MTEVAFATQFLSSLSSKPQHIEPNHVEDPTTLPARNATILPRMPHAPPLPSSSHPSAPGSERSITVTLKSLRAPVFDISLSSQPLSITIGELKALAVTKSATGGLEPAKMRFVLDRRPLADSKTLGEVVTGDARRVDLGVLVMGGGGTAKGSGGEGKKDGEESFAEVDQLGTREFWQDLKGFLLQRLKNEKQAEELCGLFETAYKGKA